MTLALYLCASQVFGLAGLACIFLRELLWGAYQGSVNLRPRPRWFDVACISMGLVLELLAFLSVSLAAPLLIAAL